MPLYSEDVQDIMERIPGRILKFGLSIILSVCLFLLVGSYLFKYPEKISCPITLITINPPITLHAYTTQTIQKILIREKDDVHQGQTIAILKNTANYTDIKTIEKELNLHITSNKWDSVVLNKKQQNLEVGELQDYYNQFVKAWNTFNDYLKLNYYPEKIALLKNQIIQQRNEYQEMLKQHELHKKNYLLAQNQFQRDSSFFSRYNKIAISQQEYDQKEQMFIKEQISYLDFCKNLRSTHNHILELQEKRIELYMQQEKELSQYRSILDESYNSLFEQLKQWKKKYIIEASISGTITFTKFWKEHQLIKEGESIVTIIPKQPSDIIGYASINMNGIGKVKKGQQVNIKLDGFPYMEYGTLKGTVVSVSMVPEGNKNYTANIELNRGMLSSYKKELQFTQQMEGSAEIITKDRRLLTSIISPLRAMFGQ